MVWLINIWLRDKITVKHRGQANRLHGTKANVVSGKTRLNATSGRVPRTLDLRSVTRVLSNSNHDTCQNQ